MYEDNTLPVAEVIPKSGIYNKLQVMYRLSNEENLELKRKNKSLRKDKSRLKKRLKKSKGLNNLALVLMENLIEKS